MVRLHYKLLVVLNLIWVFISCQPNPQLKEAEKLMDTAYDSAYSVLKRVHPNDLHFPSEKALYALLYCQALDKNEIYTGTDSLISIATDYYENRDDEKAAYAWFYKSRIAGHNSESVIQANALLKAQSFAVRTVNHRLLSLIYFDKANMYSNQFKYDSALVYHRKSAESCYIIKETYNYLISKINQAYMYIEINKPDSAEKVCKDISNRYIIKDLVIRSFYFRTFGTLYMSKKNYNMSIYYFKKIPLTSNISYDDNSRYLIAKSYYLEGKYDSAYIYLKDLNYLGEMAPDYYKLLKEIYVHKKNYKAALSSAEKAYIAIDSVYTKRIDQSFAGMEKKFNYQKLEITNKELKLKYFRAVVIILIFLLIIMTGIATIFFWRNRVRKKQLEIEKQLVINQTLRAQKEEENSKLLEQQLALQKIIFTNIEQYRNNSLKKPEKIKEGFSPIQNEHFYIELFTTIDIEYNNFSKRLSEKYPQLNDTDIFICCLLLAGFETGMIASILNIKVESMNTRRSRLRKKMHLDNQINLLDYLNRF